MSATTNPDWVAGVAESALDRLTTERNRLYAANRQANRGDRAATCLRIAQLWERTAWWWDVVFNHTTNRLHRFAVIDAQQHALNRAHSWRDVAETFKKEVA